MKSAMMLCGGTIGIVYKCRDENSNKFVAMKIFSDQQHDAAKIELKISISWKNLMRGN